MFKPIIAKDSKALRRLVLEAISKYGPSVDLNPINVVGVSDFTGLFKDTGFCGNVSKWNMKWAKYTNDMFAGTPFNGDVSMWNFKNLQEARGMFENNYFAQDLTACNLVTVWETSLTHAFLSRNYLNARLARFAKNKKQHHTNPPSEMELREKSLERCADMFGGPDRFGEYLTRIPFGVLHFDICCANAMCPVGISQENFEWSRNILVVGMGLGLNNAELRQLCVDRLGGRSEKVFEEVSLEGLLNA